MQPNLSLSNDGLDKSIPESFIASLAATIAKWVYLPFRDTDFPFKPFSFGTKLTIPAHYTKENKLICNE